MCLALSASGVAMGGAACSAPGSLPAPEPGALAAIRQIAVLPLWWHASVPQPFQDSVDVFIMAEVAVRGSTVSVRMLRASAVEDSTAFGWRQGFWRDYGRGGDLDWTGIHAVCRTEGIDALLDPHAVASYSASYATGIGAGERRMAIQFSLLDCHRSRILWQGTGTGVLRSRLEEPFAPVRGGREESWALATQAVTKALERFPSIGPFPPR